MVDKSRIGVLFKSWFNEGLTVYLILPIEDDIELCACWISVVLSKDAKDVEGETKIVSALPAPASSEGEGALPSLPTEDKKKRERALNEKRN